MVDDPDEVALAPAVGGLIDADPPQPVEQIALLALDHNPGDDPTSTTSRFSRRGQEMLASSLHATGAACSLG